MRIEGSHASNPVQLLQMLKSRAAQSSTTNQDDPQDAATARAETAQSRSIEGKGAQRTPDVVSTPPLEPPTRLFYGKEDIERLKQAWGTNATSEGFASEYDFDANGTIDGADLGHLLGLFGQEKPDTDPDRAQPDASTFGTPDVVALRAAWNTREGDEGFRSEYDFNNDGVINGADLGQLLGRFGLQRDAEDIPTPTGRPGEGAVGAHERDDVEEPDEFVSSPPHALAQDEHQAAVDRKEASPSIGNAQPEATTPHDSTLFSVLLPESELSERSGFVEPQRDARDLTLLIDELGRVERETRSDVSEERADILAQVRSSFTELLAGPEGARDTISLLLERLSQGGGFG
ncbi:MAG: hypothetical protein ACF8GE_03865 [Phycisphaerales bacterium JB043]